MIKNEIVIYYSKWNGKTGSHDLLKQAAVKWCETHQSAAKDFQFDLCQEETWKKPYFKYPKGVEFSISHTGKMWMCAISDIPVGLDVQEANRCNRDKLSKRFFHPKEDAWLSKNQYGGFYHVWAAKESYLKYTGDGLAYGMDRFSVVGQDGFEKEINGISQRRFVCSPLENKADCKLDRDASEKNGDWRFEEYVPDGDMDIQPEEDRMAVCVSFAGAREIRFERLCCWKD